ncbi:DUF7533 family protein [Halomarina oriensis]|uniref:Uncharacterized protein n=1 Tax=Halomarina oriensis TaxID=671145 RepID=A0A6B0GKT2_9EURY|nr:hypothetical protein [Halomarina oriensis]MWG35536.1 hypothetical protein [Halomarina oriensis]
MARGIIGTVQLVVTLVFAIPVGLFGVTKLVAGDVLFGGVVLAVAVGMVLVEEYLTTPQDVPSMAAEKVVGSVVEDPDADEE